MINFGDRHVRFALFVQEITSSLCQRSSAGVRGLNMDAGHLLSACKALSKDCFEIWIFRFDLNSVRF